MNTLEDLKELIKDLEDKPKAKDSMDCPFCTDGLALRIDKDKWHCGHCKNWFTQSNPTIKKGD